MARSVSIKVHSTENMIVSREVLAHRLLVIFLNNIITYLFRKYQRNYFIIIYSVQFQSSDSVI